MKQLIALGVVIGALALGGAALSTLAAPRVQEPVDALREATTLGAAWVDFAGTRTASLTAATIVLLPGQATMPLQSRGSLLLLVRSGAVAVDTDRPANGVMAGTDGTSGPQPPPVAIDPATPIAITDGTGGELSTIGRLRDGPPRLRYELTQGSGITVEPGTRLRVRGVAEAELLIVSLAPQ